MMIDPQARLFLVRDTAVEGPRDEELVAAFLRKEAGASAAVWQRCYPLVRRIVYRSDGLGHEVEDVIQEVFIRLFRKLPELRDPSSLRAFVLAITIRAIKAQQRVRWIKRWLGLFQDGKPPDLAGDSADLDAREALARFYDILDHLSSKHRTAFVLRYIEELELAEVASALDVSLATIKRWLPRVARRVFAQAQRDPLLSTYLASGSIGEKNE